MPTPKEPFAKVRFAREKLKAQAEELLDDYIQTIRMARAAGDFETAQKGFQWLIEHMPEEEGERMIEVSIDKPKQIEGHAGPTISIGFALGGVPQTKQLEAPTITVIPSKVEHE